MKKLYYIAHPYTGDIEANMLSVNNICNKLLDKGFLIFSPLTMSHPLEVLQSRAAEFWYAIDLELMEKCDGIILCGNWGESKGCMLEVDKAIELGIELKKLEDFEL